MIRRFGIRTPLLAAAALLVASPVWAQSSDLSSQTLGRSYLFLFLAYAIVWALVLGWVVSIHRRLARIDKELGTPPEA